MAECVIQRPEGSGKVCCIEGCGRPRRAREWCRMHYNAWYKFGDPLVVKYRPNFGVCTAEGCEKPPRSRTSPYCEMHYCRLWKTGSLLSLGRVIQPSIEHERGYVLEYAPGHPIGRGRSHVYEHRRVFFDTHGEGPFECHVCEKEVTWSTMHVDHLDDDPKNNCIGNLAPACPRCNQARGYHKALPKIRARGHQITAFGQTMCSSEWSRARVIPRTTLMRRLADGWPPEEALSKPSGPTGRKAPHHVEKTARARAARQRA